jgi:hypothetical protein
MGKFGYAVLLFIAIITLVSSGAAIEFKRDIGGWTFSANLDDGFRLTDNPVTPNMETFSSDEIDDYWKGFMIDMPAYFPAYPNAPKDNKEYATSAGGIVAIRVVKIPQGSLDEKLQHNVAVYGSADKIPPERKEQDMKDLLYDAAYFMGEGSAYCNSDKDIDFDGRMAHLSEADHYDGYWGTIAVLLDNSTIGLIDVYFDTKHSPHLENPLAAPLPADARLYDKRPWDVIESFKIEKSG